MFKTKNFIYVLLSFATLGILSSCEKDDDDDYVGNWVYLTGFDGNTRYDAVSFVIGDLAYVGTGYNDEDGGEKRYADFWAYNAESDSWTQVASLGNDTAEFPRNAAVAFAIDTKGYVGTGYDGETPLKDFWEFDPDANNWTQKEDFPGSARHSAVAFAINNKGYIGTGYDDEYSLKDFYEYDPSSDTWTKILSLSGNKRRDAVAFVIGDTAYVGTGINNSEYIDDFWKYYPGTGVWKEIRKISDNSDLDYDDDYDIVRKSAVAFSLGNYGYIATGGQGSAGTDCWQYNAIEDIWEEKYEFEGTKRLDAVGFAIGSRGYVATGRNSSNPFNDLWGFDPWDEQNDDDND